MRSYFKQKLVLIYSIVVVFVFFDRFLKWYFLKYPDSFIYPDFFSWTRFHFVKNEGIAFSIYLYSPILIILTCVALYCIIIYLYRSLQQKKIAQIFALSLIFFGAFSNFYDRLAYGYVIDYIDVSYFSVFNIADSMIFSGIVIMILIEYCILRKATKKH